MRTVLTTSLSYNIQLLNIKFSKDEKSQKVIYFDVPLNDLWKNNRYWESKVLKKNQNFKEMCASS
jgi:hypothetical protein